MTYPRRMKVTMIPGPPTPFNPGDVVTHARFGKGVVDTEPPLSNNVYKSVVVRFADGGLREVKVDDLGKG